MCCGPKAFGYSKESCAAACKGYRFAPRPIAGQANNDARHVTIRYMAVQYGTWCSCDNTFADGILGCNVCLNVMPVHDVFCARCYSLSSLGRGHVQHQWNQKRSRLPWLCPHAAVYLSGGMGCNQAGMRQMPCLSSRCRQHLRHYRKTDV